MAAATPVSRRRIAIDVDEVLCEFASVIASWHNRVYGGVGTDKRKLGVSDFSSCACVLAVRAACITAVL